MNNMNLYQQKKHTSFLDGNNKHYVLTIHDLPEEDKPREKLIAHGPETLALPELLAVVLVTGTKKEEILTMSDRIMKEYGQKSVLSQRDVKKLSHDLLIPIGKAAQIVAIGELGRRLFEQNAQTTPNVRTAREVYEYVSDMKNLQKEHLRGLYLNAHYKIIHDEIISIGTVDTSVIHPREVFKPAIEYAAVGVILVHNHPSGSIEPSLNDKVITKQLKRAGEIIGIELIDHIIVTRDAFVSII